MWTFDVKLVAKTRLSCKCYMSGQRMNMYTLTVYIIHGPFANIMLSHDLQPNIGCNFTYATQTILVVNVHCNFLRHKLKSQIVIFLLVCFQSWACLSFWFIALYFYLSYNIELLIVFPFIFPRFWSKKAIDIFNCHFLDDELCNVSTIMHKTSSMCCKPSCVHCKYL